MDKEIQEMFKEKNKEIIKNNLKLDIDRNINSLNETLINIFNNNFELAIKNIVSMYEDSYFLDSSSTVIKIMNKLKMDTYSIFNLFIEDKKNKLINKISAIEFNEENMIEYYNLVFSTTDDINKLMKNDDIYNLRVNTIEAFNKYCKKVLKETDIDITKSRINDYITYRLFGKLEERISSEFSLRDNTLCNKGKESYEKYLELTNITTNL